MMNDATMHRQFNPGRSPLLGLAAILATAATLGATILLPAEYMPEGPAAGTQAAAAYATIQVVTLPPVEVVGIRETKSAANGRWTLPVLFRKNG
jgi:hypothetical protein